MGIRLRGTSQAENAKGELASFPVVRGAIQLPPDGQPIVLGPDHQTTGGYPLLGVVPQCDWCLLAQVTPGTTIRFRPVDREEARSRFSAAERRQAALLAALDGK